MAKKTIYGDQSENSIAITSARIRYADKVKTTKDNYFNFNQEES